MEPTRDARSITGPGSLTDLVVPPPIEAKTRPSRTRRRPSEPPAVPRTAALGAYGERLAARHLSELGLAVLDRNWTAPPGECVAGEIDLVLRERDVLVICEVKTRSSVRSGTPHQAIDASKAARLQMLGQAWLRAHPGLNPAEMRVDLVAVLRPRKGPSVVEHVRGIG